MANDMQWPSEDEDFDAKTDSEKLVAQPAKKPVNKVSVAVSEPDAHQTQEVDQDAEQASEEPEATPEPEAVEHTADQYEHVSEPAKSPRGKNSTARTLFEIVLVLALIGVGYYAYTLYNDKQELTAKVATLNANPQLAIQKQTDDLISNVGALIQLPEGETPTVANVSDAAKAKEQSSFFANAVNGDKVLMYVKAGQAILYRPSTDKIVLVAPLTFNADTAKTTTR